MNLTREQLKKGMPYARDKDIDAYLEPLNAAMDEFGIDTLLVQSVFLATLTHESMSLRAQVEIADGTRYENNKDLQNNLPEAKACASDGRAGPWFKGHGIGQVTGYKQHRLAGQRLHGDPDFYLSEPTKLCEPVDGARSAAAFFKYEGCIEPANAGDFLLVSQIYNCPPHLRGGDFEPNGWADRQQHYARFKRVLGVS